MSDSPTTIGVIGTGNISHAHLRAYACDGRARLVGMADVDPARAERAAGEFGGRAYGDPVQMLEAERPQAVSVCTPPAAHRQAVLDCLARGAHVLCEKPLARTAAEAREMVEAAERGGLLLMTAFCHRFHDPVARARALVERGRVGRVLMYRNRFGGRIPMQGRWFSDRAQAGGGTLLDTAIHSADLFRFLVGEVSEVAATTATMAQPLEVEDAAVMLLRSRDGALGVIEASWSTPYCFNVIEIYGERGAGIVDYDRGRLRYRVDGMKRWAARKTQGPDRFTLEVKHFLDAVRGDAPLTVSGADGLRAQQIIEAAYRAAADGRWVKV